MKLDAFPSSGSHFPEARWRWALIPQEYGSNAVNMLALAERARSAGGDVPVKVTSWYRSPTVNAFVGGVASSQHLTASAMDFVPIGITTREWYERLKRNLPAGSFGQLIWERNHVHLSLPNRASGRTGETLLELTEGNYTTDRGVAVSAGEGAEHAATAKVASYAGLAALAVVILVILGVV